MLTVGVYMFMTIAGTAAVSSAQQWNLQISSTLNDDAAYQAQPQVGSYETWLLLVSPFWDNIVNGLPLIFQYSAFYLSQLQGHNLSGKPRNVR